MGKVNPWAKVGWIETEDQSTAIKQSPCCGVRSISPVATACRWARALSAIKWWSASIRPPASKKYPTPNFGRKKTMLSPVELISANDPAGWLYAPSPVAVSHLLSLLERMVPHNLEASRIINNIEGLLLTWEEGFNKLHYVEIQCYNAGLVVARAIDYESKEIKIWWIEELSPLNPVEHETNLILSLDETMEYIRHFVWANHSL